MTLASEFTETLRIRAVKFLLSRKLVRTIEDAEDATQDAMLSAWKHRDQFRGQSPFSTWFIRIAIHAALARKRPHSAIVSERSRPLDFAQSQLAREIRLRDMGLANRLADEICRLYPCRRHALLLHDVAGMKYREIAQRFGISCNAAKAYAHRARKRLRQELKDVA